jgi:hypothetical protein
MSTDDTQDPAAMTTQQLQDEVRRLRDRVEQLEDDTGVIEWRGDKHVENLWIDGIPIGKILAKRDRETDELDERVADLEAGELDIEQIGRRDEADLPIQRMRADVLAGRDDLGPNDRRATMLWAEFFDRADPSRGTWTLTSAMAREILESHGEPADPNTRKRVMQNLADYSDGLLEHRVEGTRVVEGDVEELKNWRQELGGGE